MSKYRIVPMPDKQQAKCSNCGSTKNDGRKYVDFGLEVDWYGIVFLCGNCVYDIAKEMNCFAQFVARVSKLEDRNKTLENLLLARGDSIESQLSNLMGEVKEYFDAISVLTTGDSSTSVIVDDVVGNKESDEQKSDSDERDATKEPGKATKSATGSGPKNFSSLTELLNAPTP